MISRDEKKAQKEQKEREKAEAKAEEKARKEEAKLKKEKEKEAKKSSQAAPLSTSAAMFQAMPKEYIQTTQENTAGMTDAQRLNLLQHNADALMHLAREQRDRSVPAPAAPARPEVRLPPAPVISRQPMPEPKTPAKKSSSWFSSFCCLFTCCFGPRRKEPKESSSLLRKGIN